jgi:hypothetical protein
MYQIVTDWVEWYLRLFEDIQAVFRLDDDQLVAIID